MQRIITQILFPAFQLPPQAVGQRLAIQPDGMQDFGDLFFHGEEVQRRGYS
jgi:hypothetical protein